MTSSTNRSLRVFLCHAKDDKSVVRRLYDRLIKGGVDAWLDEENLMPGQNWRREISEAINQSDAVIVCLSRNSINKEGYVQKEISYALDKAAEKPEDSIFIIPVRLEECDVPNRLSHLQWVNMFFRGDDFDNVGYKRLFESLTARAFSLGVETKADLGNSISLPSYIDSSPQNSSEFNIYHPQPLLIVISGPSGAGKDSVMQRMKERGLPFHFVVTATTREKRPNEVHGKDYFFVAKEEFARMIDDGELIEHAIVYGDHKGIPKKQVREALSSGIDVVLRIDVQGADTVRKMIPEALMIFIATESEQDLVRRLELRRTETPDSLALRIATARKELRRVKEFDYVAINRDFHLDETVDTVRAIIDAEHHRVKPRKVAL